MSLKKCPCCKIDLTTKNVIFNGLDDRGHAYVTCNSCHSTALLKSETVSDEIRHELILSLLDQTNFQKIGA